MNMNLYIVSVDQINGFYPIIFGVFSLIAILSGYWLLQPKKWAVAAVALVFILNRAYNSLDWIQLSPPKPYPFIKGSLHSGKDLVTVTLVIAGICVTVSTSDAWAVLNYGIGFLLGLPILNDILTYSMTDTVSLSDLHAELDVLLTEINRLLDQLGRFRDQFHNLIITTGINVVTEDGAIYVDAPAETSDALSQEYGNRVRIIDRLIQSHAETLRERIGHAAEVESQILSLDGSYISQLTELEHRLREILRSYNH